MRITTPDLLVRRADDLLPGDRFRDPATGRAHTAADVRVYGPLTRVRDEAGAVVLDEPSGYLITVDQPPK